jgi:hypothetical protein
MDRPDPPEWIGEPMGCAMSQVEITFELSDFIAARVSDDSRKDPGFAAVGALPLYIDNGGIIGIRPDGTLVEWSQDGEGRDVRPVEDRAWVLIALVAAARRYPEFENVMPVRGTGAIDCECRRIPTCVSGLISCTRCGRMGRLSSGDSPPRRQADRPQGAPSLIGLVLVALAILCFLGAFVVLTGPSRAWVGNGLALIVVGIVSLVLASRGISRPRPAGRRSAQGPTFNTDDPEVAALPPTSMTHVSERIRQARERQQRAQE